MSTDDETDDLLRRAAEGDRDAVGALLARDRARLGRMVRLRLDRRLFGRLDVSDVLQDVHVEAARRIDEYFAAPKMSFYVWLRLLTAQKLVDLYRHHLAAAKRDVRREAHAQQDALLAVTSVALAEQLAGSLTSPGQAAQRAETEARVRAALESLEPIDREVLALRHFEQMSNAETAEALEIDTSAASKRYARALRRLGEALQSGTDWRGA